jgi:hypothetical protein
VGKLIKNILSDFVSAMAGMIKIKGKDEIICQKIVTGSKSFSMDHYGSIPTEVPDLKQLLLLYSSDGTS